MHACLFFRMWFWGLHCTCLTMYVSSISCYIFIQEDFLSKGLHLQHRYTPQSIALGEIYWKLIPKWLWLVTSKYTNICSVVFPLVQPFTFRTWSISLHKAMPEKKVQKNAHSSNNLLRHSSVLYYVATKFLPSRSPSCNTVKIHVKVWPKSFKMRKGVAY